MPQYARSSLADHWHSGLCHLAQVYVCEGSEFQEPCLSVCQVISTFFVVGIIFVPIGAISLAASNGVRTISHAACVLRILQLLSHASVTTLYVYTYAEYLYPHTSHTSHTILVFHAK